MFTLRFLEGKPSGYEGEGYDSWPQKNTAENSNKKKNCVGELNTKYDKTFLLVVNICICALAFSVVGLGIILKVRGYFTFEIGLMIIVTLLAIAILCLTTNETSTHSSG